MVLCSLVLLVAFVLYQKTQYHNKQEEHKTTTTMRNTLDHNNQEEHKFYNN